MNLLPNLHTLSVHPSGSCQPVHIRNRFISIDRCPVAHAEDIGPRSRPWSAIFSIRVIPPSPDLTFPHALLHLDLDTLVLFASCRWIPGTVTLFRLSRLTTVVRCADLTSGFPLCSILRDTCYTGVANPPGTRAGSSLRDHVSVLHISSGTCVPFDTTQCGPYTSHDRLRSPNRHVGSAVSPHQLSIHAGPRSRTRPVKVVVRSPTGLANPPDRVTVGWSDAYPPVRGSSPGPGSNPHYVYVGPGVQLAPMFGVRSTPSNLPTSGGQLRVLAVTPDLPSGSCSGVPLAHSKGMPIRVLPPASCPHAGPRFGHPCLTPTPGSSSTGSPPVHEYSPYLDPIDTLSLRVSCPRSLSDHVRQPDGTLVASGQHLSKEPLSFGVDLGNPPCSHPRGSRG